MKNLKKLLIVVFFTVAVSLFVLAYSASAEEITYALDDGEIYFDTDTGTITGGENTIRVLDIPEDIEGIAVTAIAENAFKDMSATTGKEIKLRTVKIPATIETIGTGAFAGCKYLEEFTVSKNNKNFCDIDGVLCSYDRTTLISYPNARNSNRTLKSYDIPDGINAIEAYAFTDTKLEALDLSGITQLAKYAFYRVELRNVIVSNSISKNTDSDAFYSSYCGTLYSNSGSGGWTTLLHSSPEYYLGYIEAEYPVEGGTIYYDILTNYIVGCDSSMKVVDIPAEINGSEVNGIRKYAFDLQWNIESVYIPATVKNVGEYAFFGCRSLKSINVDDANPYLCDIDGVLYNSDITELIKYPSAHKNDILRVPHTVTRIGEGAFTHVSMGLVDISSVTKLGRGAFVGVYIDNMYANANLTEYYLYNQNYDYERSVSVDYDNYRDTKIFNVYFAGDSAGPWKEVLSHYGNNYIYNFTGNIEKYEINGGCIYYDSKSGTITGADVRNLDIPEEINGTKIVAIADNAFAAYVGYQQETECYSFDRVTIPRTIETIGENAFYGAQIDEIVISDGAKLVGDSAFYGLWYDSIDSLIVEDIDSYIGINAVWGSYSIKNLTVRGNVRNIEDNAFSKERGLQNLVLEEGIKTIGDGAFSEIGITELVIPRSVKTVEANAFASCSKLESVTYYSTTDVDESAFANCPSLNNINVIEVEYPDPEVSVDGLAITVRNLDGVKDYFIAKGRYNTYRELKPYQVRRVTEARINGENEYTYTVSEPGEYTVCVRFNDGSENLMLYTTATADLPTIETNALSVNISGLKDLIAVRTATGVWNTPGEVKRAEGSRNIAARNITGDTYTLYYPESGTYTVTLEYTNGLVVVEHIELTATEPTLVQDGNSVVIGNLDNLYTIRYAKGEYATMGEIKRADGCQVRRSRNIVDGVITVTDLEPGTYTFCVQYNDQSYNYFTVVVE